MNTEVEVTKVDQEIDEEGRIDIEDCGVCTVVRGEGATIRDGFEIDNSNIIGRLEKQNSFFKIQEFLLICFFFSSRLQYNEKYYFILTQILLPPDGGFVCHQKNSIKSYGFH